MPRGIRTAALLVVVVTLGCCAAPPPAAATNLAKPICSLAGLVSPLAGKICTVGAHPGRLVGAGKKLLGGHLGGAVNSLLGDGASGTTRTAATVAGIAAIAASAVAGARFAMHETAQVISSTTRPQLQSTWFSTAYWRMAGISALLTLPFLFAAAIQALLRSELALLWRAAFGYLPLGLLAVAIAAPVTILLLSASDEMSSLVSSASGGADTDFLIKVGAGAGGLSLISRSPFIAFVVGLLTIAATVTLWIELLVRAAAVYVIVLMLPLFFAALVWPARRVWAVRAVELLVALILSKFTIVAVLSLGGAALGHTTVPSFTSMLAGTTLILLAAFAPWALLRILPLHELAAGAAAGLHHEPNQRLASALFGGAEHAVAAHELASAKSEVADDGAAVATMRRLSAQGSDERDDGEGAARGQVSADDGPGTGDGSVVPVAAGDAPPAGQPVTGLLEPGDAVAEEAVTGATAAEEAAAAGAAGAGGAADGASAGALATAAASQAGGGMDKRRPGMAEMWQEENGNWQQLHVGQGAEETIGPITWLNDQPPGGIGGPAGENSAPASENSGPPSEAGENSAPASEAGATASPRSRGGEDHDRLPPGQEPDGGRL